MADCMSCRKREKNNAVGFVTANKGFDFMAQSDVTLREDLITIGAEKEFLGRISHIVELDKLSREELKAVLFHDKEGVIKRKKEMFAREGLELEFEDNTIDMIADRVYNENLGARSAVNIVEAVLGAYDFDMLRNGYEKMTVHTGMLNKHEAPLFERSVTK